MNKTFWSSVWLSVAIGVFVGYAITEEQIEERPTRIPEPPTEPPRTELVTLNSPPPEPEDPEPDVRITITTTAGDTSPPDSAAETTPAEAREALIQSQHGYPHVPVVTTPDPAGGGPAVVPLPPHDEL